MNTRTMIRTACCSVLLAATAGFGMAAAAATVTFNGPGSCQASGSTGSVSYTAYSSTGSNGAIEAAQLKHYSGNGLGVNNKNELCGDSPDHSVDNSRAIDSILFDFATAVDLDKVTIGWVSGDSDFSLFRYTGGGAPSILGLTYATLGSWSAAENVNGGSANASYSVNPGDLASRYWLISASLVGSSNDYFKIKALDYSLPKDRRLVPEPGTLGLLGLGLMSLGFGRRRAK